MINVNIIMPAHNASATIEKAIEGVCVQDYPNWHLIVVEDGSSDDTKAKIEGLITKHPDKGISILVNDECQGVSGARNRALSSLSTETDQLFAYCDSDDVWDPNHLSSSVTCMTDDVDLVYSDPCCVTESGETVFPDFALTYDVARLHEGNFIWISTVVHRASTARFDSAVNSLEDWDMWIQLRNSGFRFHRKMATSVTYLVKFDGMASKGHQVTAAVRAKYAAEPFKAPLMLNLGCGDQLLPGWINCDLHSPQAEMKFDAATVPFNDGTVDAIAAYHLIEHFKYWDAHAALKEWRRALKPGGKLILETPDFLESCREFVNTDDHTWRIQLYNHFFAWPHLPGQIHYFLYTQDQLWWTLNECGFVDIQRVKPDSIYARSLPGKEHLFLKMECRKPLT